MTPGRITLALLITLGAILAIGLAFLRSASYHAATQTYDPYMEVQLVRVALSLLVFLAVVAVPYDRIGRHAPAIYLGGLALLVAVLFVGREANGSSRWIPLGFMDLQPSEVMKLALIVALAQAMRFRDSLEGWTGLIAPFALTLVPMVLILGQPDLGTTLIFLPILFTMLLVGGARLPHLGLIAACGLVAAPLAFVFGLKAYQKARITAFIDPEASPLGAGYQILQSLTAVGSGRLTGRGYGEGTQTHLQFLPERHTDFIFAVIAEEWGFLGAGALLVLFGVLLLCCLGIAARTRDPVGRLMVIGVAALIGTQVIINTGMTVGLMPITGLTLPFVSFGGSSLVVSLMAMALVVNVALRPVPLFGCDGVRRDTPLTPTAAAL